MGIVCRAGRLHTVVEWAAACRPVNGTVNAHKGSMGDTQLLGSRCSFIARDHNISLLEADAKCRADTSKNQHTHSKALEQLTGRPGGARWLEHAEFACQYEPMARGCIPAPRRTLYVTSTPQYEHPRGWHVYLHPVFLPRWHAHDHVAVSLHVLLPAEAHDGTSHVVEGTEAVS